MMMMMMMMMMGVPFLPSPPPVVKVRGPGGSAPCFGLSPLLLMKKCYFMHKLCQIPHAPPSTPPSYDLLDLEVTLTTILPSLPLSSFLSLLFLKFHSGTSIPKCS